MPEEKDENFRVGKEAGISFKKHMNKINYVPQAEDELDNYLQLAMIWFTAFNDGYEFRKNSNILNKHSDN